MKTTTSTSPSAPCTERDHSNEICLLAYHLWEASGCPAGQDLTFWLQAEQQLLGPHRHNGQEPPVRRSTARHAAPPLLAARQRPAKRTSGSKAPRREAALSRAAS